ncbi:unnamed protein product [Leptosia nina]|uniref:Uncharacterized protein n=1 Tax=Leptosia nina TaxID=320188 RepID=A0AAV1JWE2_9NEOP
MQHTFAPTNGIEGSDFSPATGSGRVMARSIRARAVASDYAIPLRCYARAGFVRFRHIHFSIAEVDIAMATRFHNTRFSHIQK